MTSFNGGSKYKDFSLDGEYFVRCINNIVASGPIPVNKLDDNGFALQASGMIIDRTLQAYGTYSYVNGQYGKP